MCVLCTNNSNNSHSSWTFPSTWYILIASVSILCEEGISTPPILLMSKLRLWALKSLVTPLVWGTWGFRLRQSDYSLCALLKAWLTSKEELLWESVGYSGPSICSPGYFPVSVNAPTPSRRKQKPVLIQSSRQALSSQEQSSSPGSQIIRPGSNPGSDSHYLCDFNEALCSLFPLPTILFPRICMWLFSSFTLITTQLRCHLI